MKSVASDPQKHISRKPPVRNLDDELSWWGNASIWWAISGPSGTPSPLDWLNGKRTPGLFKAWRKDLIGTLEPHVHPACWFPFWKRDFMLGDEQESIPGAYEAIESLHQRGVKLLPLLAEIAQTRLVIGPSKTLQYSMASREQRWNDVQQLRNGDLNEQWEVIDKWAPVLRKYTPSLKITIFDDPANERQNFCTVQTWDPVALAYSALPAIPTGAAKKKTIQTKGYPDRKILREIGQSIPSHEVIEWIAKQILRLGPAKRHRLSEIEIYCCALKLEERIKNQLGTRRNRDIGRLLAAAFPDYFRPKADIANATMKLLARAHQRVKKTRVKILQT